MKTISSLTFEHIQRIDMGKEFRETFPLWAALIINGFQTTFCLKANEKPGCSPLLHQSQLDGFLPPYPNNPSIVCLHGRPDEFQKTLLM